MREIKFKVVWNGKVSNEAFTIGEFTEGIEMTFKDGGTLPFNDIDWSTDKVEYLQYTGIKDKNGNEIYDGYIISQKGSVRGAVHYGRKETAFLVGTLDNFLWTYPEPEVIGNVYENPELLVS